MAHELYICEHGGSLPRSLAILLAVLIIWLSGCAGYLTLWARTASVRNELAGTVTTAKNIVKARQMVNEVSTPFASMVSIAGASSSPPLTSRFWHESAVSRMKAPPDKRQKIKNLDTASGRA